MWLLETSIKQAIEQAQISGVVPTAEQQAQYEATQISAYSDRSSRLLTIAGNSAEIKIEGVLTKTPSFLAMLFGGGNTTYTEIISALAEAEANNSVDNIILSIDSPGGSIDGLFDTIDAIRNTDKPVKAVVSNTAASAAYALASQANQIIASNNAVRIGSIGILAAFRVDENKIEITSTDAPKKAPDVTTAEGKAVIREELDAIHNIFVDAISKGRNVSTDKINAEFGQGATLLAGEALKRGMIDGIAKPQLQAVKPTITQTAAKGGEHTEKVNSMDLATFKAQHPDVYSAAVQVGIDGERDRVVAHLTMGESSGDMDTAIGAIKDGSEMTITLQAKYMSAGMNRADVNARAGDDADAGNATENTADGGEGTKAGDDDADIVASEVEKSLGIETAAA